MYKKRKKAYERHNVWRSYSDMMAGLLLLFVLVMCISFIYPVFLRKTPMRHETVALTFAFYFSFLLILFL